jgi:hypothetical protein
MLKIAPATVSLTSVVMCLTLGLFVQCSDDHLSIDPSISGDSTGVSSSNSTFNPAECGCTYVVPVSTKTSVVDGQALKIKPGDIICLRGGATYSNMLFKNIKGTTANPVIIKNCGSPVILNGAGKPNTLKTESSSHFQITGGSGSTYGIQVKGGHHSVTLEYLTTNVELDHIEVYNSGFSGIMAKTDPSCDNATHRDNFVMRNVHIHHNYVHDTAGEGLYIGHSFWGKGISTPCGVRYPHALEGVKIHDNIVKNSGWEAIQIGSSPKGAEVYNNRIENYGMRNVMYQNHGVQFGEGAPGKFYGNFIKGGKGNALMIIGNAQNLIYNNVIINAGQDAIFCEDRFAGAGFKIINNTIINPGQNGIRLYSDLVTMNQVINNVIINPGSYSKYSYPRTGDDAFVYLLNKAVKIQQLTNYFSRDINSASFENLSNHNYTPTASSPLINAGTNIGSHNIAVDFALKPRLSGDGYDMGAYEYQQ